SWRCLLGSGGLLAGAALILVNAGPVIAGLGGFHLAGLAVLIVGAVFYDALATVLRLGGTRLLLTAGLAGRFAEAPSFLPEWIPAAYPLCMACALAMYAKLLGYWPALWFAALIPACWLIFAGVRGYVVLRQVVRGLDYLAVSLALFAVAVLISLGKSGILSRRLRSPRAKVPDSMN